MGLFDKKYCGVCGEKIGVFGNRKLEDANLCKECARKLSPWFDERRHSTLEQIKAQLSYREQNMAALNDFKPTLVLGDDYYKMFVEERAGVPYRFIVTNNDNYMDENPDILTFADNVANCMVDIDESHREIKRKNSQGEFESYFPPRYEYDYDFNIILNIKNQPYFDDIKFQLNRTSVTVYTEDSSRRTGGTFGMGRGMGRDFDPSYNQEWRMYKQICEQIEDTVRAGISGGDAVAGAAAAAGGTGAAAPSDGSWFCTECGTKNQGKFCENCGAKAPVKEKKVRCDKCGWAPEPGAQVPKFCPNCGDRFDENDIA